MNFFIKKYEITISTKKFKYNVERLSINTWESKNVRLDKLILWDENVRFYHGIKGAKNKEIVNFLFKRKNYNMLDLLELFIKDIHIPQDEKILVTKKGNDYKVLDGNRRVSVMNVLNNTNIIEDASVKNEITKLLEKYNYIGKKFTNTEVLIAPSEEEGKKIIKRRHYDEGFLKHGSIEKARSKFKDGELDDKASLALLFTEELLDSFILEEDEHQKLRTGYSTITRIFTNTTFENIEKTFFISLNDEQIKQKNGCSKKFKAAKQKIVDDIVNEKINTRILNKAPDIEKYILNFPKIEVKTKRPEKPKKNKQSKSSTPTKYFKIYEPNDDQREIILKLDKRSKLLLEESTCINIEKTPFTGTFLLRAMFENILKNNYIEEIRNWNNKEENKFKDIGLKDLFSIAEDDRSLTSDLKRHFRPEKTDEFLKFVNMIIHNSVYIDTSEVKVKVGHYLNIYFIFLLQKKKKNNL